MSQRQILAVKRNARHHSVLEITADDGCMLFYCLSEGGVLRPGRLLTILAPASAGARVHLFMPLPDGLPEILEIENDEPPF